MKDSDVDLSKMRIDLNLLRLAILKEIRSGKEDMDIRSIILLIKEIYDKEKRFQ